MNYGMNSGKNIDLDLDDLSMDVFELSEQGLAIDSLTAGHGMGELDASGPCSIGCCSCTA